MPFLYVFIFQVLELEVDLQRHQLELQLHPIDLGRWLSMVNVKPPHLSDLEAESMKKFILDYNRNSQKCPRLLPRKMKQFVLEEQIDVICDEDGGEFGRDRGISKR